MPPAAYQALTHEEVGSPAEPAKAPSVIRSGAVLAFVFLLLAGAFVWNRFYKAPGKNENNLGLSVHAEGSGLRVTWDRNIMAARNATGANLSISDGGAERRFSLDRNQLTTGSIFYTPKSGDVVIQFQTLNGANPGQSEMIRVLSGDRPSNSPLADSGSAPPVQTIEIPNLRKAEPARQAPDATLAEETETASEPKTFDAPKYDVAAPSTRTYLTPRQIAEPEVPPPAGSVQSLSTPNIPNPLRDAATAVSSAGAHSATMHRAAFVPPNPIKKIIPDKKGLSWNLNFPMEINVQVTVDKEGRVVEARDLAGSTPRFAVLVTECLRAARQWRFQPGTLDGTPVQSEYTIVFLFKP
jgi:outer membrane biosynthesis protein TonB